MWVHVSLRVQACDAQALEDQLHPRTMERTMIEMRMAPSVAISDRGLLFVDSDGDRVFWRGFNAL